MSLYFDGNIAINEATQVIEKTNEPLRIILFCVLVIVLFLYCFINDYKNKTRKGKAYAKINLFLNILNKRKDGYHNLKSVFDFIDLYDEIIITKYKGFKLICNDKSLENENNLIYKAYVKLKEINPHMEGIKVYLKKNIPMQAGLGGGSSDCATFIYLMNDLYNLSLTNIDIQKLCSSLGADVLPCYYGKTLMANGIGDKIELINNNINYYLVVIKPDFNCSTKEMFKDLDAKKRTERKTIEKLIKALDKNDYDNFVKYVYNDFEKVVDIKDIKKELKEHGADNSLLAGSGSCVFGIFKDYSNAKRAYYNLGEKYQCYLCKNKTMD